MEFSTTIPSVTVTEDSFPFVFWRAPNGPIRDHETHIACTNEFVMRITLCGLGSLASSLMANRAFQHWTAHECESINPAKEVEE